MNEKPIIFNAEMVRAILAGRKTQTRRILRSQPPSNITRLGKGITGYTVGFDKFEDEVFNIYCPYQIGYRLWVRETWAEIKKGVIVYKADFNKEVEWRWKPSIHMFKKYTRLWLEITDVRVERLQDITAENCLEEGIDTESESYQIANNIETMNSSYESDLVENCAEKTEFKRLWDSINEKRGYGWKVNPWVWTVEFKKIEH